MPHIAYHLGSQGALILLAYTSSGAWRGGPALPAGVINVSTDEAATLNQRPFHLDLRTLATVAMTEAWFPRLLAPDRGVVAVAGKAMQLRILQAGRALAGRRETVEIRGIGSNTTTRRVTRRSGQESGN